MTMNYSDFRLGKSSQHGYYVAAKYDERSTSYLAHGKTLEDVACDYGIKYSTTNKRKNLAGNSGNLNHCGQHGDLSLYPKINGMKK